MNIKFVLPALAMFILIYTLASCNGPVNKSKGNIVLMDSSYLYDKDAVLYFVKKNPENNTESISFFAKGVDAYRNKKDTRESPAFFIKSICLHPTAKAYYELGNVCLDNKQYVQAIAAYNIAEQLGYNPVSKLFYNIACAYSLQKKENESATYLQYAIEAGYSNINQIMKDPDLSNVRQSYVFQNSYQEAMSGASDPEVMLWQTFKREFKKLTLPITLDLKTQIDQNKDIAYEYEKFVSEMRNARFSRDVGKGFYFFAIVEDNANYTALVYAIKAIPLSENDAPISYTLASFDNTGTLIDKKTVGGQMEFNAPYLVCTIQPNLHFEVKQFKNVYQNDPEKDGYENNPIVKTDLTGTEHYRIDERGKFIPLPPELSMN